ncbi:hypothetical protein HMPREF0645_0476 [Hallella bergensis DSM 17361]|uniref:Uncharacterized protein n=1 Tax=Hallella bergensis DSM 17361 TaxID=585502 RepID=D1PU41_9BACT|nr:hypothetical protein HMPREF0645_0476 [Hallella bergensis DSM 17361]
MAARQRPDRIAVRPLSCGRGALTAQRKDCNHNVLGVLDSYKKKTSQKTWRIFLWMNKKSSQENGNLFLQAQTI